MKFSEGWLREWVKTEWSSEELVAQLTMAGLEIDAAEPAAPVFSDIIVGQIISTKPHPNAESLQLCQVAGGDHGEVQVVCGAPNARPGIKIPFAQIGASLPGNVQIQQAQLRGEESFGMLCSADELGLSDDDQGLWELPGDAPLGQSLRALLNCDDRVIDVDLTPNRGDCLSIRGLAREVAVLSRADLTPPAIALVPAEHDVSVPVALSAGTACPAYVGRVIRNLNSAAVTPLWLQEKLRRGGIRCVNTIVDVTNYVMLELGQPLHAFDLQKISGGIEVRFAHPGEALLLLGGNQAVLTPDTLVVADGKRALAMAGIMGGEHSAVGADTQDIFLESAHFSPLALAGRARQYGLHTDASHRFERGVDPELVASAIERAAALLKEIASGEAGPLVRAELNIPAPPSVSLRKARLHQQLAIQLDDSLVIDILQRLGLQIVEASDAGWVWKIPSWRFDLTIEADLIEEVARVYGYNNLPTRTLTMPLPISGASEGVVSTSDLRHLLTARDYQEVITYSFVDPRLQESVNPHAQSIEVANPISSDMAVMRASLWPGLLSTLQYNLKRQQRRVRIFEVGLRFTRGTAIEQEPMLAGLICGGRSAENWTDTSCSVDFYDIKGDVSAILGISQPQTKVHWSAATHPALHPGQTTEIKTKYGISIGYVGKLHPNLEIELDLGQAVYLFELKLSQIAAGAVPRHTPISRFPAVRRDIAVVVDDNVSAEALKASVQAAAGEDLIDLMFFDVYRGKGVENHRKSVAMGLTFQSGSRTLTDQDITTTMELIIKVLENTFGASLRK